MTIQNVFCEKGLLGEDWTDSNIKRSQNFFFFLLFPHWFLELEYFIIYLD